MNEFYNKRKFFEETKKVPSEIYYHYTSINSLYEIVKNKTFWLTSLQSSNDKKELFYSPEAYLENLLALSRNEENAVKKVCLESVLESVNKNKKSFMNLCKKKDAYYSLCLSTKKDNLTHWDRYGANCTGVCIGFNISSIKVMMQRQASEIFGENLVEVGGVIYDEKGRNNFIVSQIIHLLNKFAQKGNLKNSEMKKHIITRGYIYAYVVYRYIKIFSKMEFFVDEDEIRLCHANSAIKEAMDAMKSIKEDLDAELFQNINKNFAELVKMLNIKKEEFYVSKSGIRGYKNLCLKDVWGSGVIPEIILGPMCQQNKKELKRFLYVNGLQGTKVSVSKVPIR